MKKEILITILILALLMVGCQASEKGGENIPPLPIAKEKGIGQKEIGEPKRERLPSPSEETVPLEETTQSNPIMYEVYTSEEVFPPNRIPPNPLFSAEQRGIFASTTNPTTGEELSLRNLHFKLFLEQNLNYRLQAQWEVEMSGGFSGGGASGVAIYTARTPRLTQETVMSQIDYISAPWAAAVEIESHSKVVIDENKEYLFVIQSCSSIECASYNLSVKTPPIPSATAHCNEVINNGPSEGKINLIFVPENYSLEELRQGKLERDVNFILFENQPNLPDVLGRRAFFGIPLLNRSSSVFNVIIIHDQVPCCFNNQLFALSNACGVEEEKGVFVVMQNKESGTAFAQGLGEGNWIMLPKGHQWEGGGVTLAHELGHLIGLDEEYYILGLGGTGGPRNAPNCDYGNLSCSTWCSGVQPQIVSQIHQAQRKYDECIAIFNNGSDAEWHSFCSSLNFDKAFQQADQQGNAIYGTHSANELCALPPSSLQAYVCYLGTFVPYEQENIGLGCQEGFGCYLGCGTHYYYTKSDYVNIMGGGALGENGRIYREVDATSTETILPDYSPAAEAVLERYFERFR